MSLFTRSKGVGLIFCTLLLLFSYIISVNKPAVAESDNWISTEPLAFAEREVLASTDDLPPTFLGNIPCSERDTKTRPYRPLLDQSSESIKSCVVETRYGSVSKHGTLQRPGSSIYGPSEHINKQSITLLPIPRSETGLYRIGGTYQGDYLAFLPSMNSTVKTNNFYDGKVSHSVDISSRRVIKNKNGASLLLRPESISFSSNGEWMVADSPLDGTYRINIQTGDALLFGPNLRYNVAFGVFMQTAITNDGRYAAIASNGFTLFRIYDLSTCDGSNVSSCSYKDVRNELIKQYSGFTGINQVRFLNEYTLQTFVTTGSGASKSTRRVLISPRGTMPDDTYDYLGLGDSFSSGEGAFNYKAFTDTDENKCHNSLVSYPFLIGNDMGMSDYESVACSGATTFDIRTENRAYNEDPQAKNKTSEEFDQEIRVNFLPGYRPQRFMTLEYQPKIITLGIGGNNIGFGDIVKNCVMPGTCYNSYAERKMLLQTIDNEFEEFVATYTEVVESSADSRVYVHGYPSIVAETSDCNVNVRLNENERMLANGLVSYLNRTIERAAAKAGVYYVDVEDAFTGYRLCEQRWQWELAVNGMTAGDDKLIDDKWILNWFNGPIGNESYHPNARGHELYKASILSRTDNLSAAMPAVNHSVQAINDHSDEKVLGGYEPSPIWRDSYYQEGLASDSWFVHDEYDITVPAESMNFQPGSDVEVWVHSTPVQIGTFKVSSAGEFRTKITVPAIEPGYHTLHVLGINSSGEIVDIYDHIYVGHSRNDFDGDGIMNQDETCLFGDPAGLDVDQDGVDDACDGVIGQAPSAIETSVDRNNNVLGNNDKNTSSKQSENQSSPTEKLANHEGSLLLAAATGTDTSDNETDSRGTSRSNTNRVLGEQSGEKLTQGQGLVGSIKDDKQPYIVLATILVAGTAGGWLFFRKS